jgi:hypothetical protein
MPPAAAARRLLRCRAREPGRLQRRAKPAAIPRRAVRSLRACGLHMEFESRSQTRRAAGGSLRRSRPKGGRGAEEAGDNAPVFPSPTSDRSFPQRAVLARTFAVGWAIFSVTNGAQAYRRFIPRARVRSMQVQRTTIAQRHGRTRSSRFSHPAPERRSAVGMWPTASAAARGIERGHAGRRGRSTRLRFQSSRK